MPTQWITTKQASELTGYHPDYIRKLVRAGHIQARKWLRDWQVEKTSLERYCKRMDDRGERRGPKRTQEDA